MPMQRVAIASWESIGTQIPLFCGWRGAAVSGARPRKAVNVLPDIVVVRLLDEVAHRHVFDHAPAQRADGLLAHWGAPVLRLECLNPSILKTERPPVTCARSKSYCGRRNRPTAPPAPPAEAGSFFDPFETLIPPDVRVEQSPSVIRGYTVRVIKKNITPEEAAARRKLVAQAVVCDETPNRVTGTPRDLECYPRPNSRAVLPVDRESGARVLCPRSAANRTFILVKFCRVHPAPAPSHQDQSL